MKSWVLKLFLLTCVLCAAGFGAPPPEVNVCPQAIQAFLSGASNAAYVNAASESGTCNQAIIFAANGTVTTVAGNPNPYDGKESSVIGVVNNSSSAITSFQVSGTGAVFALGTHGICAYFPFPANSRPCFADSPGASNYAGSSSGYTGINAALDTGTINFTPGIPPGGTGYFSLAGPAQINVLSAAILSETFTPNLIPSNGISSLTFTIANPNPVTLSAIAFTDPLPVGITFVTSPPVTAGCGGTVSVTAGTLTFSGGTLPAAIPPASATCSFSVTVSGSLQGAYQNVTSPIVSTGPVGIPGQPGNAATATLTVLAPSPALFSKSFAPARIGIGGVTTLTFTIANPNVLAGLSALAFTDNLPGTLTVAFQGIPGNNCGGTVTAAAGSGIITFAGGVLAAGASCTISVNVTGAASGSLTNVTSPITSSSGSGNAATAVLSIAAPPLLTETFHSVSIPPVVSALLTFALSNPNPAVPLSGIAFSDSLPAGLFVSSPNGLSGTCGPGVTASAGSSLISVAGVSLAAGASCTITLSVTSNGTAYGLLTNTTSPVTSGETLPGSPATATLFLGDPYQVSYFPNLNAGDSVIDISNAAMMPVTAEMGIAASVTGSLCANVYAFTPDEQIVSCCSCPVTPNGIVSYSLKNDVISNRLNGAVPSSVVVKLLATVPVGGTCANSAAGAGPLATGMVAWGTKLHVGVGTINGNNPVPQYAVSEAPFTSSSLSTGELNRVREFCGYALAQGSGNGVCAACRNDGLGAEKQ